MPRVIMLIGKRADLSLDEFKAKYEAHVQLVEKLIRPTIWPQQYSRNYFDPAQELLGMQAHQAGQAAPPPLPYHVMMEMAFKDEADVQTFQGAYMANVAQLRQDEATFMDHGKMLMYIADDRHSQC